MLLTSVAHTADNIKEFNFEGTLSTPQLGETSVSGQFGFDFTTDAVTSYKFTAPGDIFDSAVRNATSIFQFTSSGTPYLDIGFDAVGPSMTELAFNPIITMISWRTQRDSNS
jgi:hypothetical protein